jgi:peptidoglycan/LPS O-acetylase OafA/YrhL
VTLAAQEADATEATAPAPRWHDLDALRGFAMLLGIALHASLSFFPGFWVVVDSTADSSRRFDEFFHVVHGFRMPLFFVLSGFFTTMLWRKRGLGELIRHRLKRIVLPLAIFVLPLGVLMTWTIEQSIDSGISDYIEENDDLWAAVFFGNEAAVEQLLDGGADVNAPNLAEGGDTPLHIAAFTGDVEMTELLLERGADPEVFSGDGRPVEFAVFFGNVQVADLLVASGATDPRPAGSDWSDLEFFEAGVAEAEQIQEELGLDPWVGSGWWKNLNHLWFLWFLAWLVAGFVIVALVVEQVGKAGGLGSGVFLWALIPITLAPQLLMGEGGDTRVFGPDTSTGWIPVWHVLAYYAVFFAFGALAYGRIDRRGGELIGAVGRWWTLQLVAASAVFAVALDLTFDPESSWLLASIAQVAFAWLTIFGLVGLFRWLFTKKRRGIRYLSDSTYFLYLAHLPLIVLGQNWIRNWDLPASVKFTGLTVGVTIPLLLVYELGVRYSPIGTLLNGKRRRPTETSEPESDGERQPA